MSAAKQTVTAIQLDSKDLPVHCPNANTPQWSSHPRVFLELDEHGATKCPYCGTDYQLKPGVVVKGH